MALKFRNVDRPTGVIATAPRSIPRYLRLAAQNIGEETWTLPDGSTTTSYILAREPVPASLANASDYIEQAVTDTSSALQIDQRFVWAENQLLGYYSSISDALDSLVVEGTAPIVLKVGALGDGTHATYIDQIQVSLEVLDSSGTYTQKALSDITLSTPLSNDTTSWVTWDWYCLLNLSRTEILATENIVLRVRLYGYMDTGGTSQAVRLYFTRGSTDSFVDIPLDET